MSLPLLAGIPVLALLLSSCTSTLYSEPREMDDVLVVGKMELHVTNIRTHGNLVLHGHYFAGISVSLQNVETGKEVYLKTEGSEGFFNFVAEGDSIYKITQVCYQKIGSMGGYDYVISKPDSLIFETESRTICNLGSLFWRVDSDFRSGIILQRDGYIDIVEYLGDEFPESEWIDYESVNIIW